MSEIKNGGLDHHGKVLSLNGIGGERVNFMHFSSQWPVTLEITAIFDHQLPTGNATSE